MRVMNDDKKLSLEAALEHYGVKGMRWGVRRSEAQLNRAARKASKGERGSKNIKEARKRVANAPSPYGLAPEEAYTILERDGRRAMNKYLKTLPADNPTAKGNPDRVTAARMTAGEKVTVAILAGSGAAAFGPAGVSLAAPKVYDQQKNLRRMKQEVRAAQRQLLEETS